MNPVVSKPLVFAFTSVAMVAGFVAVALLAIPLRAGREEMTLFGALLLLPVPALCSAAAFWFITAQAPGGRVPGTLAVLVGGLGATVVFLGLGGLVLVLAPLTTAGVAVLATRLLRAM